MPFKFATAPHARKHGPGGYETYQAYKDWLRDEFTFRCVYCLERERWYPNDAEVQALYFGAFGFPDDLPDLSTHTRATNTKPEGVSQCYHHQREAGTLPRTYGV